MKLKYTNSDAVQSPKLRSKFLACLLTAVLVCGLCPYVAFAEGQDAQNDSTEQTVTASESDNVSHSSTGEQNSDQTNESDGLEDNASNDVLTKEESNFSKESNLNSDDAVEQDRENTPAPQAENGTIEASSWDDAEQQIEALSASSTTTVELDSTASTSTITIPAGATVEVKMDEGSSLTRAQKNTGEFVVPSGASLILSGSINAQGQSSFDGACFVTVEEGGSLTINAAISVDAPDSSSGTASFIDCADTLVMNAEGVVSGWKTNNKSGSAAAVLVHGDAATFTMNGGSISSNAVTTGTNSVKGGAVQLLEGASFTMNAGSISNNNVYAGSNPSTVVQGGGIYADNATLTMADGTISNNMAVDGGGVYLTGSSSLTMTGGSITNNVLARQHSTGHGGGIYVGSGCSLNALSANISGNHGTYFGDLEATQFQGGAIYAKGSTTVVDLDNVTVQGNRTAINSDVSGGGMWMQGNSDVTFSYCKVSENSASIAGGGIGNGSGTLSLSHTDIVANNAGEAGGIYHAAGTATFDGGETSSNTAICAGGVENNDEFVLVNGDITKNAATATEGEYAGNALAGGVANLDGSFDMQGGHIFDNVARDGANGFYNNQGITFTLANPSGFGLEDKNAWFEDKPGARYADVGSNAVEYSVVQNDTTEQYLTLGYKQPAGILTLQPQDMVAYTGGNSMDGDNFPAVRYRVVADDSLREALGQNNVSLTLNVDGQEVSLDAQTATVGDETIVIPELKTTFTLDENAVEDDEIAGEYFIGVEGVITAQLNDGRSVAVKVETDDGNPATLTVRTVSNAEDASGNEGSTDIVAANPLQIGSIVGRIDDSLATASVDAQAQFYTNGDTTLGVLGSDPQNPTNGSQISLLFDDLLAVNNGTVEDTKAALAQHAGIDATKAEFKYLDLINEHDGNAWVSTDSDITISWPIPEGVNSDEATFSVYHFQGLHREYGGASSPDAADQIEASTVEQIPCEVQGDHVVFTLKGDAENGSFSPFALSWSEDSNPLGPDTEGDDGSDADANNTQSSQSNDGSQAEGLAQTGDRVMPLVVIFAVLLLGSAVMIGCYIRKHYMSQGAHIKNR